jgi:hypothetical protein
MKTMTCRQLGGACEQRLSANTFDEIAMMVSKHAREMVQQGDAAHIEAMNEMRNNMISPEAMNVWMDEKRKAFNRYQTTTCSLQSEKRYVPLSVLGYETLVMIKKLQRSKKRKPLATLLTSIPSYLSRYQRD